MLISCGDMDMYTIFSWHIDVVIDNAMSFYALRLPHPKIRISIASKSVVK